MAKKRMTLEEKLEEAIVKDIPYEINDNWIWSKLGVICNFIDYRGKTPKKTESGVRLITAKNIKKGYISLEPEEFISESDYDSWMTRGIPKYGDVIFTTEAPLGNVAQLFLSEKYALAQRAITLSIIDGMIQEYLKFVLLSPNTQEMINQMATGTTVKGIKASRLKELPIPVPPLKEQQRIVNKIESLFEKLDKAKELIEEAREDFEKRKSAVVYKVINQFGNEKIKLKECIRFITDKKEPVDGDVYIGLENMGKSIGIINYSIADNVKSTKTKFDKGDILYGRLRPYLDKHDVADRSGICSTDILVMRVNEKFEAKYIDYILGTLELIRYANENSSGINLPRVSAKVLGEYEIPNIEFDKQKEVVEILNKIFEDENKIEELTKLEEQIELIKKSILAKAVRGQLGINCEEDESALELLKEILKDK